MKNDFIRTLRGEPHDRAPYQELEVSARHVDAVLGRPLGLRSVELPPDLYAEFTLATGQQAMYFNALWKAGRVYRTDSEGRSHYVGGRVRSRADFATLEPFDLDAACARLEGLCRAAARHGLAVILSFPSPFRLALYAMGYDVFFLKLMDEPDLVRALMDHFAERAMKHLDRLLVFPVDAFFLAGSICTGSGPMLSPGMLDTWWTPGIRRFLRPVIERNLPVILHMDGDFSPIAELLLSLPVDALHPFEVTGGLDIFDFHERHGGRVTLWGNIDLSGALTRGTPEAVAADARDHVARLNRWGRYILGSSHEISSDVPVENFLALVRSAT